MLLFVLQAYAGAVPAVPPGADALAVLVCPWDDTCDADAAWVERTQGDAPFVPFELVFERDNGGFAAGVDTRAALATALAKANDAAAKGHWAAVSSAVEEGKTALAAVRGDVNADSLFTLAFLEGAAARAQGGDKGEEYAFRQAAAIANGQSFDLPPHNADAERAWLDEQRRLVVGGTGTLALGAPEGVTWSVDGVALGPGTRDIALLPGNHRAVATLPHTLRSWQAEVPVLPGRTVTIAATFSQGDSARWVQTQVESAFDTLQASPEVTALLSDWATRNHLAALRLLRVEGVGARVADSAAVIGRPDPSRPVAADGERVDHGDGIPATYTEEVIARDDATRDTAVRAPEQRLRVVWFDPALQRFTLDAPVSVARPDTAQPRFRVSLHLGYTGMMDHAHAAVDLGGAWRVAGPIAIEARLGMVRADAPYNLYPGWVDLQLYHVSVAARWAPPWPVAPFASIGPEIYIPAAVGARVDAGVQIDVARSWVGIVDIHGGWLDTGPSWGAGLALGHSY